MNDAAIPEQYETPKKSARTKYKEENSVNR